MEIQDPEQKRKAPSNLLVYSGMGIQMLVTILGAVWLGMYLDERAGSQSKTWTLTLTFLGIAVAFYLLLKPFLKASK